MLFRHHTHFPKISLLWLMEPKEFEVYLELSMEGCEDQYFDHKCVHSLDSLANTDSHLNIQIN